MRASQYRWNKEMTDKLISLIYEGKSINELSDVLNLNNQIIYARVSWINKKHDTKIKNKLKENNRIYEESFDDFEWNDEYDALLIDLRKKGLTYKDISKEHIITSQKQLQDRVLFLNIEPCFKKRWTQEEEEIAVSMYLDGKSFVDIGERLDRSSLSIEQKLITLGIKKKKYWNEKDDKALGILYEKYDIEYISEILNKKPKDVLKRLKLLGFLKDENKCVRCGESDALKSGKYKGYCKECADDIKCKEKVEQMAQNKDLTNKKAIDKYIETNVNNLKYCPQCDEHKDIYKDYYYSVSTTNEGYTYVSRECKVCAKKRTDNKRLKNLKNKGYI